MNEAAFQQVYQLLTLALTLGGIVSGIVVTLRSFSALRVEMIEAMKGKIGAKEYGEKNTTLHGQINDKAVRIAVLEEKNAALERANSEFATALHDMRNKMQVIVSSVDLLKTEARK